MGIYDTEFLLLFACETIYDDKHFVGEGGASDLSSIFLKMHPLITAAQPQNGLPATPALI